MSERFPSAILLTTNQPPPSAALLTDLHVDVVVRVMLQDVVF